MRIIISGLTAAGKTTHARLLAAQLAVPCFNAGEHLADLHTSERHRWTPDIDAARKDDTELDRVIDSIVRDYILANTDCVVDAWAAPWFELEVSAIRIWIDSDFHTRTLKAQVSECRAGSAASYESRARVIEDKDEFSRQRFLEMHGFDIATDRAPFDVIIDNGPLISEANITASDRGIDAFAPVVLAAASRAIGARTGVDLEAPLLTDTQEALILRCP